MSYSVYLQKFSKGDTEAVPFEEVKSVLQEYGSIGNAGKYIEFTPYGESLCEVALLSGSETEGITGIVFERPVSGEELPKVIFRLLCIPGMCFFEQDCTYVMACTDVSDDLPEGLLDLCPTGRATVINSAQEILL